MTADGLFECDLVRMEDPLRTVFTVAAALSFGAAIASGQPRAADLTTTLVSFCAQTNCTDGDGPTAGLIADASGNLFGTAGGGGAYGYGTVFEVKKTAYGYASTPTTLVSFNGSDGRQPYASLIADADGNLFGTTLYGGASSACAGALFGCGTVFEVKKTANGYASTPTTLVSFNGTNGAFPNAGLIAHANGNLFGTTSGGGTGPSCSSQVDGIQGCGTVFEIKTDSSTTTGYASTPTVLVSFCGQANCADGASPIAGLIAHANGNLFSTTSAGGAYGSGTVFEVKKTANGYASTPTTLVSFNGSDGQQPYASLIADADGNLFGTTSEGGGGTVFKVKKTANGYASTPSTPTTLVSFNGSDGQQPYASLIADANGNLFGTTLGIDALGYNVFGTVFVVAKTPGTPPGYASTPTTLLNFNDTNGAYPVAGLIADANGDLFGTTAGGGNSTTCTVGCGTVFEITGSGFVAFVGTPGKPNCHGQSVSALARQYVLSMPRLSLSAIPTTCNFCRTRLPPIAADRGKRSMPGPALFFSAA